MDKSGFVFRIVLGSSVIQSLNYWKHQNRKATRLRSDLFFLVCWWFEAVSIYSIACAPSIHAVGSKSSQGTLCVAKDRKCHQSDMEVSDRADLSLHWAHMTSDRKCCGPAIHYENTPIQIYIYIYIYIENFTTKNWKFSDKNSDIFHISAQNMDYGYSLEPPRLCFWAEIRKIMHTDVNPSFTI